MTWPPDSPRTKQTLYRAAILLAVCGLVLEGGVRSAVGQSAKTPVLYSTDLFHPHDDPDDHFDLVTLFALPELEVRAIVLDLGAKQVLKPGRIPIEQMFRLAGRRVPYATGLEQPLESGGDTGVDQPEASQGAVKLILDTLRAATQPVTVIATGSARDLCAAFNREPDLLRRKVARAYLNIGNADPAGTEYNVELDRQAFCGIMRSGLPIYLCPCLPMSDTPTNDSLHSTFWQFRQEQVLATAPLELQNFFIYSLQTVRPDELDPQAALTMNLRPWRHLVWKMERKMWCTAPLLHAAQRPVYRVGANYVASSGSPPSGARVHLFDFVPARVAVDASGKIRRDLDSPKPNLHLFRVADPANYHQAMREVLSGLVREFPIANEAANESAPPQ